MKKEIFVATIQVAIEAVSEADAADGIHALMADQDIVDWRYASTNDVYQHPQSIGVHELAGIAEGDIFKKLNNHPVS